MGISRRDWMKKLGIGGAALGAGMFTHADVVTETEMVTDGDPDYASFARNLFKIDPTMKDVPSAFIRDGKVIQPARELPVFSEVDVAVVGGGPAGFAAAVAAARTGAKVALIERYGSLGGLFTNGMVLIILGTCVRENNELKLYTAGICEEFMRRLSGMGDDAITKYPKGYGQPTIDPEAGKVLMDEMIAEAGVEMFFHSWGVDVIQDGNKVQGVIFESKQGRQAVLAKCVVDATGDGDINFLAGGTYQQITHALGFVYQVGNSDRINSHVTPDGKGAKVSLGAGEPIRALRWKNNLGPRGNGLDVRELSKTEVMHRKSVWNKTRRDKETPGFGNIYLSQTCSQIGVRATRLLGGVTRIDKKGAGEGATFADTVAYSGDDHGYQKGFAIPYGSLLPAQVDNLLCAGRCISCAPDLIDRVRLIGPCFVTGHAAGVGAALAAKNGVVPRAVPPADIQRVLREQGAYLG
ncbi:MAG: FAD-dependent oxidoreductase [Kiritimatiellae bacterium]|nr:FAD-dependent oxidoreductase [Kiritimatiellia bacterium]